MADRVQPPILTFNTVCDALGINSALLRRHLIEWKHAVSHQRDGYRSPEAHFKINRRERHSSHRRGRPPTPVFQTL